MDNPIALCVDRNPFPDLGRLITAIARVGFAAAEWLEPTAADPWSNPESAAEIRELSRRNQLTAQYHAPYEGSFDLGREEDSPREPTSVALALAHVLDRTERLGARLATIHLGTCPPGLDRSETLRNVMEGLRLIAPELEKRRIRLALENHTRSYLESPLGDRPEDFDWLLENVRSTWIGLTIDIGHANVEGHVADFLTRPLDRLFNVHMHDNHGESDEHLPLGRGCVQWDEVLARLRRACYTGPVTLEFFADADTYLNAMARIRSCN